MITSEVVYLHNTKYWYAVLADNTGEFWLGCYDPHIRAQNGEPLYAFVGDKFYSDLDSAVADLEEKINTGSLQ